MTDDVFEHGATTDVAQVAEELSDEDGDGFVDQGLEDALSTAYRDWSPAATFDALYLAQLLGRQSPPSRIDIHTFAYLACLMFVFRGNPASDWDYAFTAIPPTLPFSPTIDSAIDELESAGSIDTSLREQADQIVPELHVTADGRSTLEIWRTLPSMIERVPFLEAAGRTAIFTSVPSVVNSVSFEPNLAQAVRIDGPRMLLSDVDAGPLYDQFAALLEVLGPDHHELLVPATLYVNFLQHQAREEVNAPAIEPDNL